jgi:hypothetical protein
MAVVDASAVGAVREVHQGLQTRNINFEVAAALQACAARR